MERIAIREHRVKKRCNIDNPKEAANLIKNLKKQVTPTIGLVKRPDGSITDTPNEALHLILDTPFPNSVPHTVDLHLRNMSRDIQPFKPEEAPWRSIEKIRAAINRFKNKKAPGPDELGPSVLKHLTVSALEILKFLYDASITSGYTPNLWRQSKVIFIPKSGKDDYALAKSFRPISLTPFLFKVLERLCQWRITETALKSRPLSSNQHAFREGRSCDSAISQTVNAIEKSLLRQKYVLTVFIDIASAFDRLDPKAGAKALRDRGIDENIVKWYENYLLTTKGRLPI
jgi:hypothetical protein